MFFTVSLLEHDCCWRAVDALCVFRNCFVVPKQELGQRGTVKMQPDSGFCFALRVISERNVDTSTALADGSRLAHSTPIMQCGFLVRVLFLVDLVYYFVCFLVPRCRACSPTEITQIRTMHQGGAIMAPDKYCRLWCTANVLGETFNRRIFAARGKVHWRKILYIARYQPDLFDNRSLNSNVGEGRE